MTAKNDSASTAKASVSDHERERMVAAGAWFRAERRGFHDGDPVSDWLDAEAEIDGSVERATNEGRWAEYEADRRLRWSVADRFDGREPASTGQILTVIDEVVEDMLEAGDHDPNVLDKVATTFRKDVANWAEHGSEQSGITGTLLGAWQEGGKVFLEQTRSKLEDWRERLLTYMEDHRTYYSGEVVAPGGFACVECGTRQEMEHSGHLGPCANCYNTRFRRIWKL
jgi:hypothetical protein